MQVYTIPLSAQILLDTVTDKPPVCPITPIDAKGTQLTGQCLKPYEENPGGKLGKLLI